MKNQIIFIVVALSLAMRSINKNEIGLLINGNLKKNDRYFQFVGVGNIKNSNLTKINDSKNNSYKIIDYKNSQIIYNEKEYLIENFKSDFVKIKQLIPNTKIIIMGGSLQNLTIVADFIPQKKILIRKHLIPEV